VSRGLRGGPGSPHAPAPAGTVSLLLLIYLVFTSFWPISALYLAWIIFDWDTPEKGGDGRSPPLPPALRRDGVQGPPFPRDHPSTANGGAQHPTCSCPPLPDRPHGGKRGAGGPASSPAVPPRFAGGRRLPCLRRWPVWRHFRDYFPVKVRCGGPGWDIDVGGGGGTTQKLDAPRRYVPAMPCCPRSW